LQDSPFKKQLPRAESIGQFAPAQVNGVKEVRVLQVSVDELLLTSSVDLTLSE
jgi:hypothetical protein